MYGWNTGVATSRPSTALNTEMAGRDHPVAVEQRRAEQPDEHEHRSASGGLLRRRRDERRERDHAAFAAVVGAHDEREVLDGDDEDERPDDERQQAEHVLGRRRQPVLAVQRLAERVDGARADVAVDDAKRGEGQRGERAAAGCSSGAWWSGRPTGRCRLRRGRQSRFSC